MKQYNELLKKYQLKPQKIEFKGKVLIVTCDEQKYVIKLKNERQNRDNKDIFDYLNSRSFYYYPKVIGYDNNYDIMEFIDEIEQPKEQKMQDLMDITSILHNKTTFYQNISEDDYKKIYEDIKGNIAHLRKYYEEILDIIDTHIYMSPSEYLFATNYSKIVGSLNYCEREIEKWLEIIKNKKKMRYAVIHNNLDLTHFIKNKDSYLLNWKKSRIDNPIFDLYKLYKKNALTFDFTSLLKQYESIYPLLEEERLLLFILISLPDKIDFYKSELDLCVTISQMFTYINKTEELLSPYYLKDTKKNQNQKDKN